MIDRTHDLPIARQAKVLGVSRGVVYYRPRPVSVGDLKITRRLDELHLDYPFAGSRMLRDMLNREGASIGRRHVATLMKRMGIEAIYRCPNTSKPAPGHEIYPYLLRGVKIERANHVWANLGFKDGTHRHPDGARLRLSRGGRRCVQPAGSVASCLDQMEAEFCIEALQEALVKHGKPEIFNTDQGSQFTSLGFTGVLLENGVSISLDGKGAWPDNVFVERLWRSVKYEEIYLRAYDSVTDARASIRRYLDFFNHHRPHSSLDRHTPDEAYFGSQACARAA